MKTSCIVFGFLVLLSGCSGLQVAQNGPEANQSYGVDCAKSGYQEGTQAYADCIAQTWKLAKEKERARQQREEMLLMIKGSGTNNSKRAYTNPFNPWR